MAALAKKARKLLDGENFACVATVMPDGPPRRPWTGSREGDVVVMNATESRQRTRNPRRDPRVAPRGLDIHSPYRKVMIRGKVLETTKDGADEHIDRPSMKYHVREHDQDTPTAQGSRSGSSRKRVTH